MPDINFGHGVVITYQDAAVTTGIVTGFDATSRGALADDTLVKVRKEATKSNLTAKFALSFQVSTFDPKHLGEKGNFFTYITDWQTNLMLIREHFDAFYMNTPFYIAKFVPTIASTEADNMHEAVMAAFYAAAAVAEQADPTNVTRNAAGIITHYNDGTNDIARPTKPAIAGTYEPIGNLLDIWHTLTEKDVVDSMEFQYVHVPNDVCRQNLKWTYSYLMDCMDTDMQAYVISKINQYDATYGQTGPMVFYFMAKRIMASTENLAQKIISGLISMRLTDFEGENVTDAIFTIRNATKFLGWGTTDSFAPKTTPTIVFDIFRGTSIAVFRNYMQNLQDFDLKNTSDLEQIFTKAQDKYDELVLSDRWVPTKKKGSNFYAQGSFAESGKKGGKPNNGNPQGGNPGNGKQGEPKQKKERRTHDASGREIDYNPPKKGEPHWRTRDDGVKEYWCGKCKRWGSHDKDHHDEFFEKLKKKNQEKKKNKQGGNNGNNNNSGPSANFCSPTGTKTFLAAATGRRVTWDPELVDGIDIDA